MESIVIHPSYFGPIAQYVAMVKADNIFFENEDNYQKQTYRNRMYIYDSNGELLLNIPIKHRSTVTGEPKQAGKHQLYKEVKIENDFQWQKQHWRALKASYQTSPFFEFYEDDIYSLYHTKFEYLLDFNYACLEFITDSLQLDLNFKKTSEYIRHPTQKKDLRFLIDAKSKLSFKHDQYAQVFKDKHGFLSNLSILDLLFCEGPNTLNFLEVQKFKF